jgi:hypothetical protein
MQTAAMPIVILVLYFELIKYREMQPIDISGFV